MFKDVFDADFFDSDAKSCFAELKINAVESGRFYPEDWEIAYVKDKPIGLTLPQLHDAEGEIGSNFYLGVLPCFLFCLLHFSSLFVLLKHLF